jgi:predicted kinase
MMAGDEPGSIISPPILIVFGGLPGVGKSTIAAAVARRLGAAYLRIDVIEVALSRALGLPQDEDIGPAGYLIAYDVARSNLALGANVVADCVNAIGVTRAAWRDVAASASARCLEVAVICSDAGEHRRRVDARSDDPAALQPPTWAEVEARAFEPWPQAHLMLDTARLDPESAAARVCEAVAAL